MSKIRVIRICAAPLGREENPMIAVVQESDITLPVNDFVEEQRRIGRETKMAAEIEVHLVKGSFDSPGDVALVIKRCMQQAGGVKAVAKRLFYRNIFLRWCREQTKRLTETGVLQLKDPPPAEYRLKDLEEDIRTVGEAMLKTQTFVVPCNFTSKNDRRVRELRWSDNQLAKVLKEEYLN